MADERRCKITGVLIGAEVEPIRPLGAWPAVMYFAGVKGLLHAAGLFVSPEWADGQYHRVMLHKSMGLTPEESAEELRPFAEAAKAPRYDDDHAIIREWAGAARKAGER